VVLVVTMEETQLVMEQAVLVDIMAAVAMELKE
jgi:hypothetical protein